MQVGFALSQSVKICLRDCTRDENLTPICITLNLDLTILAILWLWSCLSIRKKDQNAKLKAYSHLENRWKSTSLMWSVIVITVNEAMGVYYHFCSCQEARTFLTNQDNERDKKRGRWMIWDGNTTKRKNKKIKNCEVWVVGKIQNICKKIQNLVKTHFPCNRLLLTGFLLAKTKDWSLYDSVQCDSIVPYVLTSKFANFPRTFRNTEVGRNNIRGYLKNQNYATNNEMLEHPQRMLISSFRVENGTV